MRADIQTAGHGRHGRSWHSAPGNLFASVLVRPQPGERQPVELSFVAALALLDAATPFAGRARLSLKWPNDLLLAGAKCAGILLERAGDCTVIGFGLNLVHSPAGLERRVAALAAGSAAPPHPATVLERLRLTFAAARADWRGAGFAPIRARWLARATPVGHRTSVTMAGETREGRFAGIAEDGALLLERDGAIETIYAGDVWEK